MSVTSLEFFLAFLVLAAVFFLLPGAAARKAVMTACNLAFVASLLPNPVTGLALAIFVLSGYVVARLLQLTRRAYLLHIYFAVLIISFLIIKKYDFLNPLLPHWLRNHPLGAVGLSYMLFRQIHFLVDVMQQQIEDFSLLSYLNYQLNLFGFLSGPIQRYQEFHGRWNDQLPIASTQHEILGALLRMLVGFVKVSLISTFFFGKFELWRNHLLDIGPVRLDHLSRLQVLRGFAMVFYGYPLYLYFNFSGYCDVVIAAASLMGIALPENFDRPYLSRNMLDYWTRFHRSLGFWIRDYLFTPIYKAAAIRWTSRAALLVYPCYIVAFVLAGVWHGSTINFAIFGVLHGIGASLVKLWEQFLIRRIGRKGLKAYNASTPIRIAAIVLTLHFAAFTYLFFPTDLHQTMVMIHNVFATAANAPLARRIPA